MRLDRFLSGLPKLLDVDKAKLRTIAQLTSACTLGLPSRPHKTRAPWPLRSSEHRESHRPNRQSPRVVGEFFPVDGM